MNHHYGYIKLTEGVDGDHVDVFIKPGTKKLSNIYVVNQVDPKTQKFDEHKCMLGFNNLGEAKKAYLSNYEKGWNGIGSICKMPLPYFKEWVYNKARTKKKAKSNKILNTSKLMKIIKSMNRNGILNERKRTNKTMATK